MNGSEEVSREPVIPCGDPAKVLEAREHALNSVPIAVKKRGKTILPFLIDLGRNVGSRAFVLDLSANGVAVVSLVAVEEDRRGGHRVEQGVGGRTIGDLSAAQQKSEGATAFVGQRMDFGGSSAARATDRLAEFPPLPPEAHRCALTAEESIMTCAGGPPAAAKA